MEKYRISTNIGVDEKVTVELKQNYDLLEILSLKFTQKEIYSSRCADYGVICGRITANDGYGIPNARVSIFVPMNDVYANDPVISQLYPYKTIDERNEANYRYNLLPSRKQHGGHTPTGTFPDQSDILNREEVLEVYENYYNYTVKTNGAGDFMIWGVPIGVQTIHVDVDLSDIGCFSLRPYDFIKKGVGVDQFERFYSFKSSSDIDGLPQIVTFNRTIEVFPLWGNTDLCEIGITRSDFDLSSNGITIDPISLILVSSFTDENQKAVKRNGAIRKNSGYKCSLQTHEGDIECVRHTGRKVYGSDGVTLYPELEFFNITETIDENGVSMVALPMNMEYLYTNEFGEEEITNDPNKGIPTTTIARFRFSLNFNETKVATAKYLVPNIREYNPNADGHNNSDVYSKGLISTYLFSDVFEDYINPLAPSGFTFTFTDEYGAAAKEDKTNLILGTNNNGIPEDYFYKFIFGKVYTVSSFQGSHTETPFSGIAKMMVLDPSGLLAAFGSTRNDSFLGVKEIRPNEEEDCNSLVNYFPTNYGFQNRVKFTMVLTQILLFIQFISFVVGIKSAEYLGRFFYSTYRLFYSIKMPLFKWRPFERLSESFEDAAYKISAVFSKEISIITYPDCEDCVTDDNNVATDKSLSNNYCLVAEAKFSITVDSSTWGNPNTVKLYLENASDFHNSDTDPTYLENLFPNDKATSGCGVVSLLYSNLTNIHTMKISVDSEPDVPRYFGEFYPIDPEDVTGAAQAINSFYGFFEVSSEYNAFKFVTNGLGTRSVNIAYNNWKNLIGREYSDGDNLSDLKVILRIYDRSVLINPIETDTTLNIEAGCLKYDKTYDEDLVYRYLWATGNVYGNAYVPPDPLTGYTSGFIESITEPTGGSYSIMATIIGDDDTLRLPRFMRYDKIPNSYYDRKTKSGLTEFRDGVFTIIPVIKGTSKNLSAIKEWYRRKRVGSMFCGGVINYAFVDNWLNGVLYFFKFNKKVRWHNESTFRINRRTTRYPRELIFFNPLEKEFYYRCTPYDASTSTFIGQKYKTIESGFYHEILHPTTFYDVGVRDEFFNDICTDSRLDPASSVIRDITPTSYQEPANIIEHAINYRMDISAGKTDVSDFFTGTQYGKRIKSLDGDIRQLISINSEAGIEAFDLDSPEYFMLNGDLMDPEIENIKSYFHNGSQYGPTPIDFKLDDNGSFVRLSLNYVLGDYSQKVPFYLWDKGGTGFGPYSNLNDEQKWDRTTITSMKLQRIFSVSGATETTTNYLMPGVEEKYLLKPMTITHPTYSFSGDYEDTLERFTVISLDPPPSGVTDSFIEQDLWLKVTSGTTEDPIIGDIYVVVNKTWTIQSVPYQKALNETFLFQTAQNYSGNKQVLSSPFLFYFGLRPQKTALDLLIKYYGPKDAFTEEN